MEDMIKKIKEYAINNNVPILRDKTLKILLNKIQNNFGHCRYDSNDYDVSHFVI